MFDISKLNLNQTLALFSSGKWGEKTCVNTPLITVLVSNQHSGIAISWSSINKSNVLIAAIGGILREVGLVC